MPFAMPVSAETLCAGFHKPLPRKRRQQSQLTGRQITRVTVSDDEWKDRLVAQGTPEGYANYALEIFTASRRGEFAAADPTLGQLLGRTPTTFRDVLAATLPA